MKNAKLKSFKPRDLKPKSAKSKSIGQINGVQKNQSNVTKVNIASAEETSKNSNATVGKSQETSELKYIQKQIEEEKYAANRALKVFVFIVIFILSEVLIPDFALLSDLNKKNLITSEDRCLQNLILIADSVDDYNYKRGPKRAMKELDLSKLGILNKVCGKCSYSGRSLDDGNALIDKIRCKIHGNKRKLEEDIATNNRLKILARISLFIVKIIVIAGMCYVI